MKHDILFNPDEGDVTARLQAALDHAGETGQRLVLGDGVHHVGGLMLRSGVDLHLSKGAILKPAGDYAAYASTTVDVIAEDSDRAMLVAKDAKDILITGEGVIDAPGAGFIAGELDDMGTHLPARLRPRVMVFDGCRNVRIEDVTVRNSPMWTLHFIACEEVSISRVTIENDRQMPNTDGIVIDSCSDVIIDNTDIATADDGIVLKTTRRASGVPTGPCRSIRIRKCRIESQSCALKIGTESFSDFKDIEFTDCDIVSSNRALGIFSRDGGVIDGVAFRRITVDCRETPDGFWGSGEAITVNVVDRRPEAPAGAVCNVLFEDVSGSMEGAINLAALGGAGIAGLVMRRINLQQRPGSIGTGERYDLRPTAHDLAPAKDVSGRANAYVKDASGAVLGLFAYPDGMPGLFALNVDSLQREDVWIERPEPLPAGWSRLQQVMASNTPL
ncbi:glycoside hydrolase family 28 protein [Stappia sp. BW2]|uniref:polygalacturonase PglB n=1 Tax=Stappia sp. BW2 TaxID=2592622 RepID=UPI0011DEE5EE|nr:glycoside hydrolase family 28 protein [Stappia sp. BW2]TYC68950.1 glycoside hydrolase family 28 protein [Stappia sp. BW2]